MSELVKLKDAFYRVAISHGISAPEGIHRAFPLGYTVSDQKLESWLKRLQKLPEFGPQRRYVNRFKLGADPEFVFVSSGLTRDEDSRVDAHHLGLQQGPAFGADNNGRLAEIRPHPSRCALRVCASILSTLRWMSTLVEGITTYQWRCGAFVFGDGIGGHVHMGRKRPTRADEVRALDNLTEDLLGMGVYPTREMAERRGGDRLGQHYGMPGDFRLQTHGYEYRTFPSWLDSPALAFISITLAKLCVHCPGLVTRSGNGTNPTVLAAKLRNLLAYFKDTDDDALLALYLIKRGGFPRHVGWDFKGRWGITTPTEKTPVKVVPLSIAPSEQDVRDMFDHLFSGVPIPARTPTATWHPTVLPDGYALALATANTHQAKGLGEMIWDICYHKELKMSIQGHTRGVHPLMLSRSLVKYLPSGWQTRFPFSVKTFEADGGKHISIGADWREGERFHKMKKALLNGVLPIWDIKKVHRDSLKEWKSQYVPAPVRFKGKVLYEYPSKDLE